MKDRYFWEQLIKNITELEFQSLVEVLDEKANTNKWEFLSKSVREYEDKIIELADELDDARRDIDRLEDDVFQGDLNRDRISNILDLLESGNHDEAVEILKREL